ncbi:MAG: hypothetical protein HY707_00950 [Ignavibacteriae bacterium]|nr:hypothetical protein [Ignavibacteriota bacterium]
MMKKLIEYIQVILLLLSQCHSGYAENGDDQKERLETLVRLVEGTHESGMQSTLASEISAKCGLLLAIEIQQNWQLFTDEQKRRLQSFVTIPVLQKNRVIGHFRVHYDTTGSNEPALLDGDSVRIPNTAEAFIDSVGKYFNEVWDYEIDSLGYEAPPFEVAESFYNIYVEELSQRLLYGETFPLQPPMNTTQPFLYRTHIRIDNDFLRLYSPGISGLKVTAAHEFHHAIQLGRYGYWGSDPYFLEITSTWMEDVVYDAVNDYYQYIKTPSGFPRGHFTHPDLSFTFSCASCAEVDVPYSRAIWGKFIEKRFSRDMFLQTWKNIRQVRALQALDQALFSVGSSFREAFLEWTIWNFNTGPNSDTIKYYAEGKNYPRIDTNACIEYMHVDRSFADSIQAISSVYFPVGILASPSQTCQNSPQMMVIISNLNFAEAYSNQRFSFRYDMSDVGNETFKQLVNGVYVKLNVPDPANWTSQETVPSIVTDVVVYPNPFFLKENKLLKFRLPNTTQQIASLYIFSSSLDRIYSGDLPVIELKPLEPGVAWNARDETNALIPSGIYFFVLTTNDKTYKGKFSVIRE